MELIYNKESLKQSFELISQHLNTYSPDIVLSSAVNVQECLPYCQKYHVPLFICSTVPSYPSSKLTPVGLNFSSNLTVFNNLVIWSNRNIQFLWAKDLINSTRASFDLPPISALDYNAAPHINMYSPLLFPRPSDWPENRVFDTGFWNLPFDTEAYVPDKALQNFLESGDTPIYVGFGPVPLLDHKKLFNDLCNVTKELNLRMIYCHGNKSITELGTPEHVLFIKGYLLLYLFCLFLISFF